MSFDISTIRVPAADGLVLTADVAGPIDGAPVVLAHGGGQTRHAWGTALRAIATAGWRTYSIDQRGHGDSDWSADGDYRLESFASDVAAVGHGLGSPAVFAGASLGGLASLLAIGEGLVEAKALILVDVAPKMEPSGIERIGDFMTARPDGYESLEEVADAIAAYNPHRPRPSNLDGLRKNLRQSEDGRWMWHWDPAFVTGKFGDPDETRSTMTDPDRLRHAAAALEVPTLLVRGRMSDLLSEEGAKDLLELVPHARLVDVAGAGHMVAGDRNDLFNHALIDFLADLD